MIYSREDFTNALLVVSSIILSGVIIFISGEFNKAFPYEISEATAVRCIIGEAGNQGEHGMIVLAEALRNRGTTKGVYGCNAKHIDKEPKWVWELALASWRASASTGFTKGADHWENTKTFGEPYWAKSMVMTYEYKDHRFYKER